MSDLTLAFFATLAVAALVLWLLASRARNRRNAEELRGYKTREEINDETENLSDAERYDAGNKWVRK